MKLYGTIFSCIATFFAIYATASEHIIVEKQGVTHAFVHFDAQTDYFTEKVFQNWENDTFEIFDQVKDDQGIAIDIGAWIGTTAIWLSKNFYHVIAIDADAVSVECLKKNLAASSCSNVTICDKPILDTTKDIVFGPRGEYGLNASISYIKPASDHQCDYNKKSITFKQMLYEYVFVNKDISTRKISFIKCDIEGGEENILEDVLHFAYNNSCKAYVSFHLPWWQSKNLNDFKCLFDYFKTNCPTEDICDYIRQHPFSSILFEPKQNAGVLIKKNIPAVVIGYNQLTFIRNMVSQLERYTSDILVIDNASTYPPLLDYYENDFKYTLLRQDQNYGYRVYRDSSIQKLVGDLYILTDPDLQFNKNLPDNFIQELIDVSEYFKVGHVGFALLIDSDDIRTDIAYHGRTIKDWESQFWMHPVVYPPKPDMAIYQADIDTTFNLTNRRYAGSLRVAGDYTCVHLPWHKDFQKQLENNEYEAYLINNNSTNWFVVKE